MYELIEHRRLDGSSSITFSNISQNYSDLCLLLSIRGANSGFFGINFNGSSSNITSRILYGNGAATASEARTDTYISYGSGPSETANTFANYQIYIPNYSGSTNKSWSLDGVGENNATTAHQTIQAGLWSQTAAITSLTINNWNTTNLAANSSATLYGVNRRAGIGRAPLAMGGYMSYSNGYWVHTFPSSGSFIPFTNMDVEYLVIAGGGGGGFGHAQEGGGIAAGGGAGGYRSSVIGELSGGGSVAESRLSLTANTNYSITIGAGGSGSSSVSNRGGNGSNSVFHTITSTGGGGGGSFTAGTRDGASGGSGGGGATYTGSGNGGAGTSNQGFAGGNGNESLVSAGGGGGAGATGINAASGQGGNGGSGVPSSITGFVVTRAGGGGSNVRTGTQGVGGSGGGGNAAYGGAPTDGTVNTGSGGGARGNSSSGSGGAGGSGIVIVRYRA